MQALTRAFQFRDASFERLKFLVNVGGRITSENAFAGKQPGEFFKTVISARAKFTELLAEFFEFLTKLAEQTKRMVFSISHSVFSISTPR